MPKFKGQRFKELITELSQDQTIKEAMAKLNEKSKIGQHVKQLKDFLPFAAKLAAFGGKRTAGFAQHITLIIFLFEVSVLIKKNVFDRPEVQKFYRENWGLLQVKIQAMYVFCSNQVKQQLDKAKAAHARRRSNKGAGKSDGDAGDRPA